MKKLLAILLGTAVLASWLTLGPGKAMPEAAAQTTGCLPLFHEKTPPVLTRPALQASTVGLCYEAFAVMYSGVSRTPLWSAEHLTRDSLERAKEVKR